jgi:RNA 2',3'-cyclic 3'-phosphodiesterase
MMPRKRSILLYPQKERKVNIQLGGTLLASLFTRTNDLLNPMPGLAGPTQRSPSQLFARRLLRRHAGLGPAAAQRPATDRLFFAVRPDPETAAKIAERTMRWRAAHGLTGKPLKPEHLHVTLFHVGDDDTPPPAELIDALAERAAQVAMPAFRVEFDRVMSFSGGAFVLGGDDHLIGLHVLQQRLSDALDASPAPARRFEPHVTLLRDNRRIAAQPIEPISWTAREIVLVHSLLGQTIHRDVVRVPLRQA